MYTRRMVFVEREGEPNAEVVDDTGVEILAVIRIYYDYVDTSIQYWFVYSFFSLHSVTIKARSSTKIISFSILSDWW